MVTLWLLATIKKYLQFLKQFPTIKSPVCTRIPKITTKYIEIKRDQQSPENYPKPTRRKSWTKKRAFKKGQEIGQNGDFWPT